MERYVSNAITRVATSLSLLLFFFSAVTATAGDSTGVLTGYSVASWTETDSGPIGAVSSILQDQNGYLWIGTTIGLFRFDGSRFVHWDTFGETALPASPVSALHLGHDGALWVGFANRSGVGRITGRKLALTESAQMRVVNAVVEDAHGSMWAVADPALFRLAGNRWEPVPARIDGIDIRVLNAGRTGDGSLWISSPAGLFVRREDGSFEKKGADWVWSISQDKSGEVWLTDTVKGFRRQHERTTAGTTGEGNGYRIIHDRYGDIWLATIGEGLWRVHPAAERFQIQKATLSSGLFSDSVQSIFEDRDGNLWVGTTAGLHRLTRQRLNPITNVGLVTAAEVSDGQVWAGTNYGVVRLVHGQVGWNKQRLRGPPTYVNVMHRDRSGVVWVGAMEGLRRIVGDRLEAVAIPPEYGIKSVACLSSDLHGGVWIGNGTRVVHFAKGRFSRLELPPDAPDKSVVCVLNDSLDRLWIGHPNAKLSLRDRDGRYSYFGAETFGPEARAIRDVLEFRDGSVWIPTNSGITRITDKGPIRYDRASGLPVGQIWSIAEDSEGFLWLSLDAGLVRVARSELERSAAAGQSRLLHESFDASDGLAGAPILRVRSGSGPGVVWFLRGGALTVTNPETLAQSPEPRTGTVRIEDITSDDRSFAPNAQLTLHSGTKRLEIDYTSVSLSQPGRARFRYRLNGFDTEWIQAANRRTAVYTNLPPRDYEFVVEVGSDGVGWNEAAAKWQFSIAPAFYQTSWFYGGCLLTVGLVTWGTWRFRVNVVRRQYAAVLAERTRMSREIHDTLLQGVLGAALQLDQLAHALTGLPDHARVALLRTRRELEAYVREARQSISALRSPVLEQRSPSDVLRDFGDDAIRGTPVNFTLTVAGRERRCSPRLENELLRIGQEAITNAVRHANAQSIAVELKYEINAVTLSVMDDGCGIAIARAEQGGIEAHYGLVVMRERAEHLGGSVTIAPLPQGGTRIEAVLPAPAAA